MNERTYFRKNVITFRKTKEAYGGLSNMAAGFFISINNIEIRSSEALYQALRYPNHPEIQKEILLQRSPMTAKMISKKYRQYTREDWNDKRISLMRWCLRVKLIQNWDEFGALLLLTEDKIIVEESRKDKFWGAIPYEDELIGVNALGRLLMELRDDLGKYLNADTLNPPNIDNLKLLGNEIKPISFNIYEMPKSSLYTNIFKPIQDENITLFDSDNTK